MIGTFTNEEEGQGLVEYGLILGLISIIAIAALQILGLNVDNILQTIADALTAISS